LFCIYQRKLKLIKMQTVLGAGGVIGKELAVRLRQYTDKIRLAGRNPKHVTGDEELVKCDLTDRELVIDAVDNSEIVYLTAGLKYDYKIWKVTWPKIIDNVIEACKIGNSKLVFFDNVYMYGKTDGWMTENTPANPVSKKGEIRARISERILSESASGNIKALIARSADFYGPDAGNSILKILVFDKLKEKNTASWFGNDDVFHSFTYTPDAGKATALLGNTPDAYNQVWHLPTHKSAMTGQEYVEFTAEKLNTSPKYRVIKKWMTRLAGLIDPLTAEIVEMMYQYENDYLFNSTKFENKFFAPVTYSEGISECLK